MAGKKKKVEESKGGAPEWMVTFGDLMSLLLTFFVLLVSFSSIQQVKFQKALGSLHGALGLLPYQESVVFQNEPLIPQLSDYQNKRLRTLAMELKRMVREGGLEKQISTEMMDDGILVRIDSPVLFALGDDRLKPNALPILKKIAESNADLSTMLRIEGHTDDLPIHTNRFPSNWELSTARALSVLRYFVEQGISPDRLAAVGYGEYHPLVPNTSPENRAKNRRVEIYILSESLDRNLMDDANQS
ncbi:MAG: flagellar motor protein MotB [Calditrichaeota bacterium]|nr:MAG: flagellar motor protein MotB [Calditrichota bacterium]